MPAGESARRKATQLRAKAAQLESWALNWDAGAIGEERVAAALADTEQQQMRALHDRLQDTSGSKANIDHLVVNPAGIYVIDAKNWTGETSIDRGSLRQRWTTAAGQQSAIKDGDLREVRQLAARLTASIGQPVTPVLCLANDNADAFGAPQELDGVHVVPVAILTQWLERRPRPRQAVDVKTVAVQLSCRFPPAGGDQSAPPVSDWAVAGTRHAPTAAPRSSTSRQLRPPRSQRRRPVGRPANRSFARVTVGLLMLVAFALVGPKILVSLGKGVGQATSRAFAPAAAATTAVAAPALSRVQARALDDWRIRASLYAANDQPSTLAYIPDANLESEAQQCRTQRSRLTALRGGLLKAPDSQLAATAKRFDVATHDLLHACIANDPVGLHHAQGAMTAAASDVNARYNRLVGLDPTAYNAKRVI